MGSDIMTAVTIYEINGVKYTGPRTINVTSHPCFLSFVRLCIDGQEYSLGSDDLMRAVYRVNGQPLTEDQTLVGSAVDLMRKFVEESARAAPPEAELPPR